MSSFELRFELHGRLSVFLGVVRLQSLTLKYPDASGKELERVAAATSASFAAVDWAAARNLVGEFSDLRLDEDAVSMRRFLDRILKYDRPLWLVTCVRGRASLRNVLPPGVRQCFAFARVLDVLPDEDAVAWWDALVGTQRDKGDLAMKERGRQGERLTFGYEIERLNALGVNEKPRWVALDDETLGYDVLTYDINERGQLENRMIEVKACSCPALRIYLTRGEWDLAARAGDAYRFHVWHLPTRSLSQFSVADLAVHVPADRGSGAWQKVLIPLRSARQ